MPINFRRFHWALLLLLCLAGGVYSWFYFPSAFPILDVNISMDRASALKKARTLAERLDLGPNDFDQAASFNQDSSVQTYVELEAGGKQAFRRMIRLGRYEPFQWHVRHYRPGDARETLFRFTPSGKPYGFKEKWPETAEGPSITSDEALAIARKQARAVWDVPLDEYQLISRGQTERPNGRVDHTFVYEHEKHDLGKANYRLRLGISGNQLSEVTYFVKVPEAFSRRYKNMRSANNLIKGVGNIIVYCFYVLVGCLFGCFWLVRRRALKWRMPLIWGGGITILLFLTRLNRLPLSWMQYDTATAPGSFISQLILNAVSSSLLFGFLITLTFVAAEGLTRMAFGHHPRLWKLWNPDASGSRTVMSLTLFGYALVGLYFAYNVALYGFAFEYFGWWAPSNLLYDPNILSHYVIWLKPVVNALRAGFWEECLFRAIPLAGAALLGRRYGRRSWWIGTALIVQALVFGAGHASYATQPSYARVVELFFSSIGLGVIYLGYGLLPAVIVHFLYDLILMSMPIFVSSASLIWLSQGTVLLLGLIPLIVTVYGLLKSGGLHELSEQYFNRSWSASDQGTTSTEAFPVRNGLSWNRTLCIVLMGVLGCAAWAGFDTWKTYEIPLQQTRSQAIDEAKSLLEANGEEPGEWTVASKVVSGPKLPDRFVWQDGGRDAYKQLMGSYLHGPSWEVRFMTFQGDVARRAEEYRVRLAPGYGLREIQHYRPEAAAGDSLTERKARVLADSAVRTNYGLTPDSLKKVSAEPQSRPNRRDWTFTYGVPEKYPLDRGEARIDVTILGSEITDTSRYVHVPESWRRQQRSQSVTLKLISTLSRTLMYLIVLVGALTGLVYWGRGWGFGVRAFIVVFAGFVVLIGLETANRWPSILADFDTAEPYLNQVFMTIASRATMLLRGGFLALTAGLIHGLVGKNRSGSRLRSILGGLGIGVLAAGLMTLSSQLAPSMAPPWGNYSSLETALPIANRAITGLGRYLYSVLVILLFAVTYHRVSRAGMNHSISYLIGVLSLGFVVTGVGEFRSLMEWALQGSMLGFLFMGLALFVFPYDRSLIPTGVAGYFVVAEIRHVLMTSHPYVYTGAILSIVTIVCLGVYWNTVLQRRQLA
ncbi:MAG: lysostaphin resistance A-like protein [bacterium]